MKEINDIIAKNKMVRVSARKLRLIADTIRGKGALSSLEELGFLPKAGTIHISKVLKSAIANAENNFKLSPKKLYVKEVLINEGPTYKRYRMASKGRVREILKRTSNIYIKLGIKKENGTKN